MSIARWPDPTNPRPREEIEEDLERCLDLDKKIRPVSEMGPEDWMRIVFRKSLDARLRYLRAELAARDAVDRGEALPPFDEDPTGKEWIP